MKRGLSAVRVMQGAALLLLGLALSAPPAGAQLDRPCAEDLAKHCSGITPGGGRLLACYEREKANMSSSCVAWAEYLKKNLIVLKEACSTEIDARCNFEKGDPLEMLDCLQGNYLNLSQKCMDTLNRFKYNYKVPVQ